MIKTRLITSMNNSCASSDAQSFNLRPKKRQKLKEDKWEKIVKKSDENDDTREVDRMRKKRPEVKETNGGWCGKKGWAVTIGNDIPHCGIFSNISRRNASLLKAGKDKVTNPIKGSVEAREVIGRRRSLDKMTDLDEMKIKR